MTGSNPSPAEHIVQACIRRGLSLATAESCTGGLLAARLTAVSGASGCFLGGVVAYDNAVKERLLGVSAALLEKHGAVSAAVAEAMAAGAQRVLAADYAAAITGIAGPTGGTSEKPVGLVYIAVAGEDGVWASENHFHGDRDAVRAQSVEKALAMLAETLGL